MIDTNIDDGGPAFACPETEWAYGSHGMSLRDWFAGQALTGFVATATAQDTIESADEIAKSVYRLADAMLDARKL